MAEHGGVSAARMKGLSVTTGDFVYFTDADDFVSTNLFADFCRVQTRHSASIKPFISGTLADFCRAAAPVGAPRMEQHHFTPLD